MLKAWITKHHIESMYLHHKTYIHLHLSTILQFRPKSFKKNMIIVICLETDIRKDSQDCTCDSRFQGRTDRSITHVLSSVGCHNYIRNTVYFNKLCSYHLHMCTWPLTISAPWTIQDPFHQFNVWINPCFNSCFFLSTNRQIKWFIIRI